MVQLPATNAPAASKRAAEEGSTQCLRGEVPPAHRLPTGSVQDVHREEDGGLAMRQARETDRPVKSHPLGTIELWHAGPPESEIRFALRHLVMAEIAGRATRWSATLTFDFEQPSLSSVEVVIDAASLDTGATERDNHVRSAEFLDVFDFPQIRFESREVRPVGPGRYEVAGDLTIRDVTRTVTLEVEERTPREPGAIAEPLVFTAQATIDRQAFGLHWNQDLDVGGVVVGDKIDLRIALEARRAL
jgi:polyisoprenoid-binding protein YceI